MYKCMHAYEYNIHTYVCIHTYEQPMQFLFLYLSLSVCVCVCLCVCVYQTNLLSMDRLAICLSLGCASGGSGFEAPASPSRLAAWGLRAARRFRAVSSAASRS